MCKFSSPLPLAQGQLYKMGLIGIMGALAAWLLLKDECLIYVSVILTLAWLNGSLRPLFAKDLPFKKVATGGAFIWQTFSFDTVLSFNGLLQEYLLSEITKSTNKFNRFSSHLSGLFLWYQNVNRWVYSRIDVDKRKKDLFGKYPPSRDVKIQSASPPFNSPLLWIHLAGPSPDGTLKLVEIGP